MKHRKFAEMNEVKIVLEDDENEKLPQDSVEQKVETSKIIAYSPLLKMGIIGGGILLLVVAVGSIISGSLSTLNTTNKIEPTAQQQPADDKDQAANDPQTDKTLLALTTQSTALKNFRDQKAQPTPTTSPTPVLTPIPTTRPQVISKNPPSPTTSRATTRVQPRVVVNPVQPRATTPVQPTVTTPVQPRVTSSIQSTKPRQIASTSNRFTALPPRGASQALSPQQQWQAIAEAGSFSAPNSDPGLDKNLASDIQGGTGQPPDSEVQTNINSSGKRILVGTTTIGKLETPIAWASNDQSSLNYLVRVTKEVKASDGTVVVPVNSYLVVQMSNTNTDNYAQLYATAILINQDGDTQERKLPENAVRILGGDGAPLKAQTGRGRDVMGSIFSATIAGIAKAAQIQNSPTSSITTSDGFSSTTSVTNGNRNVLAGFGEGVFGSILEDIKSSNERQAQSLNGASKVFVIEAGKTVKIYVNQTVVM